MLNRPYHTREDALFATLEIVSHVMARQDALIHFLIKKLSVNDEDFKKSSEEFYEMYQTGMDTAVERIFENYGSLDLEKILKGRWKEENDENDTSIS